MVWPRAASLAFSHVPARSQCSGQNPVFLECASFFPTSMLWLTWDLSYEKLVLFLSTLFAFFFKILPTLQGLAHVLPLR